MTSAVSGHFGSGLILLNQNMSCYIFPHNQIPQIYTVKSLLPLKINK